jgi:hypothetical protein
MYGAKWHDFKLVLTIQKYLTDPALRLATPHLINLITDPEQREAIPLPAHLDLDPLQRDDCRVPRKRPPRATHTRRRADRPRAHIAQHLARQTQVVAVGTPGSNRHAALRRWVHAGQRAAESVGLPQILRLWLRDGWGGRLRPTAERSEHRPDNAPCQPLAASPNRPQVSAGVRVPIITRRGSCTEALCFSLTVSTVVSRPESPPERSVVSSCRRACPAALGFSKQARRTPSRRSVWRGVVSPPWASAVAVKAPPPFSRRCQPAAWCRPCGAGASPACALTSEVTYWIIGPICRCSSERRSPGLGGV